MAGSLTLNRSTTGQHSMLAKEKHSPLHSRLLRKGSSRPWYIFVALLILLPCCAHAQPLAQRLGLRSGREIFLAACSSSCHGESGDGAPQSQTLFAPPDTLTHFSHCDETTPEFTLDYTLLGGYQKAVS
jgi:hypothetical protein